LRAKPPPCPAPRAPPPRAPLPRHRGELVRARHPPSGYRLHRQADRVRERRGAPRRRPHPDALAALLRAPAPAGRLAVGAPPPVGGHPRLAGYAPTAVRGPVGGDRLRLLLAGAPQAWGLPAPDPPRDGAARGLVDRGDRAGRGPGGSLGPGATGPRAGERRPGAGWHSAGHRARRRLAA